MLYLADTYDKTGEVSYDRTTDPKRYYEMVQWLFFQNAGVGPMQGQANRITPATLPLIMRLFPICP